METGGMDMLKTAPKFGDNMILQRNKTNYIWETAPEQEVVEVSFFRHFYFIGLTIST